MHDEAREQLIVMKTLAIETQPLVLRLIRLFAQLPVELCRMETMAASTELWSCPDCDKQDTPENVKKHFEAEHQPKETDIRYNRYVSFPHEQIPRSIDLIPSDPLPKYRESYIDTQLVQLFQQVRLAPEQYAAQRAQFLLLKNSIEEKFPEKCRVDPAWDELPRLALNTSPFDVVIRLSRTYLNPEKLRKYEQIEGDEMGRVAKIGGSFLNQILPIVKDLDNHAVVYYCKSKITTTEPHVRRVPGQDPTFTLKLKYIGLYFQVNKLPFDISAYTNISFIRTALIKAYTDLSPTVTILCVVLKKWAEERRVTGKQLSLLSPFCIFVMLIHFLQNYPSDRQALLPQLQQNFAQGRYFRAATEEEMGRIRNCQYSLSALFCQFFHYYADFNWKGVGLSMRRAGILPKPEGVDVLIENPLPPYDNLADQYLDRTVFFRMSHEFKRAYTLLIGSTQDLNQPKVFESSLLSLLLDPSSY